MSLIKYFSLVFFLMIFNHQVQSDDFNSETFYKQALDKHNAYRQTCGAEPLQRNKTLDQIAQSWCDRSARTGEFNHSGRTDIGENSYQKIPFDFVNDNGETPAIAWCGEKGENGSTAIENRLHRSQCLWKSTKTFGLGICKLPNNGLMFVANYYPRGNYKDQFAQNVGCQ